MTLLSNSSLITSHLLRGILNFSHSEPFLTEHTVSYLFAFKGAIFPLKHSSSNLIAKSLTFSLTHVSFIADENAK